MASKSILGRILPSIMIAIAASVQSAATAAQPDAAASARAGEAVLGAAVTVVFHLRVTPGEEPMLQMRGERCPNCGSYHSGKLESLLAKEQPLTIDGFLVEADAAICRDMSLPPANISSIEVWAGDFHVPASVEALFIDVPALRIRLAEPLPADAARTPLGEAAGGGATPALAVSLVSLTADPGTSAESGAVSLGNRHAVEGKPIDAVGRRWDDGTLTRIFPDAGAAAFGSDGVFIGLGFGEMDETLGLAPSSWEALSPDELEKRIAKVEEEASRWLRPVAIDFRSPKQKGGDSDLVYRILSDGDDVATSTRLMTVGVVVRAPGDGRLRLVASLDGKRDAIPRLERMRLFPRDGGEIEAKFAYVHSGVDVVVADLPDGVDIPAFDLPSQEEDDGRGTGWARTSLLAMVLARAADEGRETVRHQALRRGGVERERRGIPVMDLAIMDLNYTDGGAFAGVVCDLSGRPILALGSVLEPDFEIGMRHRWRSHDTETCAFFAKYFLALASADAGDMASIRPVAEDEEGATGWLGIELQPLDKDLAEAMGALAFTKRGKHGALVSKVFPGSTADLAGVKTDWILLSVCPVGGTTPWIVRFERDSSPYESGFPWERLSEAGSYLGRLPPPWPAVADGFTDGLLSIGIGKEVDAVFIADGNKVEKRLVIGSAPRHFGNAKSWKWKEGGITVCDLTFEVREYLNLGPDAPGVVVSAQESSGKAVTAGVCRFEVITKVNGVDVKDVDAFKAAIEDSPEIKLEVLRMSKTRLVNVSVDAKDGAGDGDGTDAGKAD